MRIQREEKIQFTAAQGCSGERGGQVQIRGRAAHPALLPAPRTSGRTQHVRGFSSWNVLQLGFLLWKKPCDRLSAIPGDASQWVFTARGGSRHGRERVKGIAGSSSGGCRMERCPQHNVPCWAVLLWDGGFGVNPKEGPHPSPPAVLGAGAVLPWAPVPAAGEAFYAPGAHRVCGHRVRPPPSGPSSIHHILAAGKPLCSCKRHVWQGDQRNHCH